MIVTESSPTILVVVYRRDRNAIGFVCLCSRISCFLGLVILLVMTTHNSLAKTLPVDNEAVDDLSNKDVCIRLVNTWIDGLGPDGLVIHEEDAKFFQVYVA